jgi:lipopolysaccharide export system protein LptC
MNAYTLPSILVYVFVGAGILLVLILLWTAQKAMTPDKDRPQYKSKKIVKDYYEQDGKQINDSAISGQLAKRWKENSDSWSV